MRTPHRGWAVGYDAALGLFPDSIPEAAITTPAYRSLAWWTPATILIVAAVSAVQMTLELLLLGPGTLGDTLTIPLTVLAHAVAGVACAAVFGALAWLRSGSQRNFLGYQERYLVGVGLGIVTSLAVSITFGALTADSFLGAVESSGTLMVLSLLSLELPVACIAGGLAFHLLSRVRNGVVRPRRAIEDPE
jgi:hypothetical protein